MARNIPVTGDGGYPAPGGHALNDRPEEEGDIAMGGAEDLTYRDEPERASGMRGADDAPSTAPRTRGEIVHNEELQAPQGPVHRGPVRSDEPAESAESTASAWSPSQEERHTIAMEDAAESAQPAENGYPDSTPIQDAMNQYLDYLAGSAMLPPVIPSQDTDVPIDLPQGADIPPEPELPSFMRVDTNTQSWRNAPLPPPPNQPPLPPPPPPVNRAQRRATARNTNAQAALGKKQPKRQLNWPP
ncbi:hypothetical protein B0H14DRAFT_3528623 [Mycena olivaceomarginata]|nr:hypothetical protein B0H14DRAFT_3528623 [Mycena olivaceomarginata]